MVRLYFVNVLFGKPMMIEILDMPRQFKTDTQAHPFENMRYEGYEV